MIQENVYKKTLTHAEEHHSNVKDSGFKLTECLFDMTVARCLDIVGGLHETVRKSDEMVYGNQEQITWILVGLILAKEEIGKCMWEGRA